MSAMTIRGINRIDGAERLQRKDRFLGAPVAALWERVFVATFIVSFIARNFTKTTNLTDAQQIVDKLELGRNIQFGMFAMLVFAAAAGMYCMVTVARGHATAARSDQTPTASSAES